MATLKHDITQYHKKHMYSIVIYLVEPLGTWANGLVMSNNLQIMGFFVSFSSKHLLMQFEPFGRAHWGGFVNG